jgi:hypothetical protein
VGRRLDFCIQLVSVGFDLDMGAWKLVLMAGKYMLELAFLDIRLDCGMDMIAREHQSFGIHKNFTGWILSRTGLQGWTLGFWT